LDEFSFRFYKREAEDLFGLVIFDSSMVVQIVWITER
jgi:hypothetical protein